MIYIRNLLSLRCTLQSCYFQCHAWAKCIGPLQNVNAIFIFYFACFKREMQDSIAFLCLLSRLPSLFNLKKHGSLLSEIWFCYSTRLCVDLLFFFSILFLFNFDLFPVVSPQCGALANQFFKNCSLFICTAQGIFRCIIQTVSCHMWGLVSLPGFEPRLPALGAWSLSHQATRDIPG